MHKLLSEHSHWRSFDLVILPETWFKNYLLHNNLLQNKPYRYTDTAIAWQAYTWRLKTASSRKRDVPMRQIFILSMSMSVHWSHWLCHWERYLINCAVFYIELPHLVTHFFTIIELFTSRKSDKRSMASMSNTWLVNSVNKPWKSLLWLVNHSHHWMYK